MAADSTSGAAPEPLGLGHRDTVEAALARIPTQSDEHALSDLTFGNLYLFRAAHDYCFLPGPYPCISGRTYDGTSHLIPLFDLIDAPAAELSALLRCAECFYPVSAEVAAVLDTRGFSTASARSDSDYLYRASEFIDYHGHSLRGQRTAVRKLREEHVVTYEDVRHDGGIAALAVLDQWSTEKNLDALAADSVPAREALHPPPGLTALKGTIYYVDGEPAGFILTEPLNRHVQAVRFAKGLRAFDGIYPYMFQQLCLNNGAALHWLNFEQDLGKANFRKSKLSYSPARILHKYRVRLPATPAG